MGNLRDIFDRPFAGPEMRQKYEAALGEFLVKFNATENYMRFAVEQVAKSLGHQDLWEKHLAGDDFSRQLNNLRLLALAEPFFADVPFDRLAELNATRNKLAHSHYDQDLFSEEFELVGKRKRVKMTIEEIKKATEDADDLWNDLGWTLSHFWEHEHGVSSVE
ncbi:hypothetical protein [Rhizobium laguerreae]|uniref:hypothetical protein n=1 Tax=Rhizobium laguerreae TaxID=1076926 RepID=UPI001C8FE8F3|nr:hypothetical protein [Rhizobium laguerreae]MBY3445498.1 hypothetical protein [Rhizobium laguerreae]